MHEIEKKLTRLFESSSTVSLMELGGPEAILAGWEAIIASPIADDFLEILVSEESSATFPEHKGLSDLFAAVIRENSDPIVIRNTSLLVCRYAERFKELFDLFLELASKQKVAFIRGHYLLAAFQISLLDKSKKYRIIAFLLEEHPWDDEDFLQYKAKIIGLGYAYFGNDDLLESLSLMPGKLSNASECLFELGMAAIKNALQQEDPAKARTYLQNALDHFSNHELRDREDAVCFAQLISILLDFSDGQASGNLTQRIQDLKAHLMRYHAYNHYHSAIGWASARQSEMLAWNNMCGKISYLSEKLGPSGWLNPALVIEEYLLEIYSGQRSLLQVNKSGGIDLLLRPEVLRRLSPLTERISILEQWVADNPQHLRKEVAHQLVHDLEKYKAGHFRGNESGTAPRQLSDAVPATAQFNASEWKHFEEYIYIQLNNRQSRVGRPLKKKFEEIGNKLQEQDFKNDMKIWVGFSQVLLQSLLFLEHRMNATVQNFKDHTYLFNGKQVKEEALQKDYFQWMKGNIYDCSVSTERSDIAGGRSDVFFDYTDFFIVTEVKREFNRMSMEGYEKKYLRQTLAYQATSTKLGFLLVLDLSDNSGEIGTLETNVKLTLSETPEGVKRGVVILRMPANRLTPSKIKEKATPGTKPKTQSRTAVKTKPAVKKKTAGKTTSADKAKPAAKTKPADKNKSADQNKPAEKKKK